MPLSAMWTKWVEHRNARTAARAREAYLSEVIERAVQESDPAIRSLAGYRKQLRQPVEHALAYIEGLVAAVPGPVELVPENWDRSPLARALFVGPQEAAALLQGSGELRAFFSRQPQTPAAIAILTATRREHTVFGTALEGEIVRRDVPQVAVEFVDLMVVAPAFTESEARRELKFRTLQLLASWALKDMLALKSLREELAEQRRILEIKLKIQQTRTDRLECTLGADCKTDERPDPGGGILADIDRRLMELPPDKLSAEAHLEHLVEALNHPEKIMTARAFSLNLNWMGVRQDPAPHEPSSAIALAEVEIRGRLKRVAVLVQVQRGGP